MRQPRPTLFTHANGIFLLVRPDQDDGIFRDGLHLKIFELISGGDRFAIENGGGDRLHFLAR